MAKYISLTHQAFKKLLSLARNRGAVELAENIHQNTMPGIQRGIKSAAEKAAAAKGRVLIPKNDFKNLSRAAGLEEGLRITKPGEFEGAKGARGFAEEIRALRGKGGFKGGLQRRGGQAQEPKRMLRAEEEDMLSFNRAEDRTAARMGRKVDRREFGR